MKRVSTLDVAASLFIIFLIVFALVPAVARMQRSPGDAKCQSNLRRWAQAMALYLADNRNRYPVQELSSVKLYPDPSDGTPAKQHYALNWVEALYPYIWTAAGKTSQDWKSFRSCPNSNIASYPPAGSFSGNTYMTYVFNANMVGIPKGSIRFMNTLMMFREMDRHVNALLRPVNISPNGSIIPLNPFLTTADLQMGSLTTNPNLHGQGSYITFADGHVAYFTTDYYPQTPKWDANAGQWYNYTDSSGVAAPLVRSIALIP